MPRLPKRSKRFGVGKEIGGAVYVHRQYESVLPVALEKAKAKLPPTFNYTVVKFATSDGTISFIESEGFDTSSEPTVGDVYTVKADGTISIRRKSDDPWIYHHKWLFVADDYAGFDVEASKNRSSHWLSLESIDFRRIGKKSYWEANMEPRLRCTSVDGERTPEILCENEVDCSVRSTEALKLLRLTSCELAHLRIDGEIRFQKSGNSFLYSASDCERISKSRSESRNGKQK